MHYFDWVANITWTDGVIALFILIAFTLGAILLTKYIPGIISKISRLSSRQIDDALILSFRKPAALILITTGIFLSLSYLPMPHEWKVLLALFYKSIATFAIGWGFYIFSDAIGLFFNHMGDRFDLQFNTIVIPFLSRIAKFLVVVLTIFMVLDQWNYHVTGLITGLGIGGLAVAMAAKDTLSNLFGGFVIITDAPFTMGDYIQSGSIEGIVEDINFRSTRIRTLDQALVTVPNSTLANQPITNLSKIGKRRILFNLPLDLETADNQLNSCIQRIRKLLSDDSDVDSEGIMVYLDAITTSSINMMIQFFIKSGDLEEWLKAKEKFNFAILHILKDTGIELATTRSQMIFDSRNMEKQQLGHPDGQAAEGPRNNGEQEKSRGRI